MDNKLSINNLTISFRTPGGKVQAVRDISFNLKQSETLAIVGESGSGKSVTSKAILGILAGNSIIENGSIIYDGMDLLKITEDEFYKLRGDRIAMIFQDPLSSLNPIMRIGKQLTEAMLLKGRVRQKTSREAFNTTLKILSDTMVEALSVNESSYVPPDKIRKMCADFDKFEFKHIELEQKYNEAHEAATEVLDEIEDTLFHIEKNAFEDKKYTIRDILRLAGNTISDYVVCGDEGRKLKQLLYELKSRYMQDIHRNVYTDTVRILSDIREIMKNALAREAPDFFSMGYYVVFSGRPIPDMSVSELNTYLRNYMDENFMNQFRKYTFAALKKSAEKHNVLKKKAISLLEAKQGIFLRNPMEKKACYMEAEAMINAVERAVDKLEIQKDSMAYTFRVSLNSALADYFDKTKKADVEAVRENVNNLIKRILEHYRGRLSERDYAAETEALILFLKKNASGVVLKITKSMAKYKAIKLMEEVGISDARKRYKQYPFEFSGGMRQRIVIAIALAANPDILICDEPTTALDVTIQAQILELINKIKADRNLSIIFITHDLGVVANMADRIAVMYAGKIVEVGTSRDVFYSPAHPYTWALLSAMPDMETRDRLEAIPGTPPNMIFPPVGDAFAERNKYALKIDFEQQPPMFKISETHSAATWLLHPYAPKLEPPKSLMDRINRMKASG